METNQADSQPEGNAPAPEIDQMKLEMLMQQIRDNQNIGLATLSGAGAALAGAAVWAAVTVLSGWQIGFMAIGIGFLVGWVVRQTGHGVDTSFGIVGAIMSLAGCVVGNYLTSCAYIAELEEVGFFEVLTAIDVQLAIDIMIESFHPMDVLFYGLAVYYGYKYSFRKLTAEEINSVTKQ